MNVQYPPEPSGDEGPGHGSRSEPAAGEGFPLPLLRGETVLEEVRPDPRCVRSYLSWTGGGLGLVIFTLWMPIFPVIFLVSKADVGAGGAVLAYAGFLAGGQALVWLAVRPFAAAAARKARYWVTSLRVVTRSGVVGTSLSSIPLERVADVTVSRNLFSLLAGAPLLLVRDVAAHAQWSGARWMGVPEPEKTQHRILEAVQALDDD